MTDVRLFASVIAGVLLLAFASTAGPSTALADTSSPARLSSLFESSESGNAIDRDAGYSAPVPGTSDTLWLFGDTTWTGGYYWFGTTAALAPYTPPGQLPNGLTEVPTPGTPIDAPSSRAPQGLLPGMPTGLQNPDGTPCISAEGGTAVSWPTGVAAKPDATGLLITYTDVCLTSTITVERFKLVEYDPATNTLSGDAEVFTDVAGLPFERILGSPIFSGRSRHAHLYLFGSSCDDDGSQSGACVAGRVVVARVRADAEHWRDGANYKFWTGETWSSDYSQAQSVISGAKPAGIVHVGDFSAVGKGFIVVEQNDLFGNFTIWQSDSLTSGWTSILNGSAPCGAGLTIKFNFCRAHIGHPELSTPSDLLLSYYNPADEHLGVMAVPWPSTGPVTGP